MTNLSAYRDEESRIKSQVLSLLDGLINKIECKKDIREFKELLEKIVTSDSKTSAYYARVLKDNFGGISLCDDDRRILVAIRNYLQTLWNVD